MPEATNYYRVLGIKKTSDEALIRSAYKAAALKCHPDKPGGSAEQFKLVQKAYETLKTLTTRKAHDAKLVEKAKVRGFQHAKPIPMDHVKSSSQFKLFDGTVYDFEIAPDRFRSRFRHGDVVLGPCGNQGVIVGLASNGVYWCKADAGYASLLYTQGMGGDRDVKLIFKNPELHRTMSSSGSFGSFSRRPTNTPSTPLRRAGATPASPLRRTAGETPSTPLRRTQTPLRTPTSTTSEFTSGATSPLPGTPRGGTPFRTQASRPATPRAGTPGPGSRTTAPHTPQRTRTAPDFNERQAQRRFEGIIRRLAIEEAQYRRTITKATEDYFRAFHDSVEEWLDLQPGFEHYRANQATVKARMARAAAAAAKSAPPVNSAPKSTLPPPPLKVPLATSTKANVNSGPQTPKGAAADKPRPTSAGVTRSATSIPLQRSQTPQTPSRASLNTAAKRSTTPGSAMRAKVEPSVREPLRSNPLRMSRAKPAFH